MVYKLSKLVDILEEALRSPIVLILRLTVYFNFTVSLAK